jgi:hypothetical protein
VECRKIDQGSFFFREEKSDGKKEIPPRLMGFSGMVLAP